MSTSSMVPGLLAGIKAMTANVPGVSTMVEMLETAINTEPSLPTIATSQYATGALAVAILGPSGEVLASKRVSRDDFANSNRSASGNYSVKLALTAKHVDAKMTPVDVTTELSVMLTGQLTITGSATAADKFAAISQSARAACDQAEKSADKIRSLGGDVSATDAALTMARAACDAAMNAQDVAEGKLQTQRVQYHARALGMAARDLSSVSAS